MVSRNVIFELLISNVSKLLKDDVSTSTTDVPSIDNIVRSTILDVSTLLILVLSSSNFFILLKLCVSIEVNLEFLASKFSSLYITDILI